MVYEMHKESIRCKRELRGIKRSVGSSSWVALLPLLRGLIVVDPMCQAVVRGRYACTYQGMRASASEGRGVGIRMNIALTIGAVRLQPKGFLCKILSGKDSGNFWISK